MAGYRGNDNQLAVQASVNLRNPKVMALIDEINAAIRSKAIMSAEESKEWLTSVVRGDVEDVTLIDDAPIAFPAKLKERLTANDQLNRMRGSYSEKRDVNLVGAQVVLYVPDNARGRE